MSLSPQQLDRFHHWLNQKNLLPMRCPCCGCDQWSIPALIAAPLLVGDGEDLPDQVPASSFVQLVCDHCAFTRLFCADHPDFPPMFDNEPTSE